MYLNLNESKVIQSKLSIVLFLELLQTKTDKSSPPILPPLAPSSLHGPFQSAKG